MGIEQINWYPGHMKKTKEMIADNLKIIDVVLEIVDARIPISSKNPDVAKLSKNKKRIVLLNKCDLVEKYEINEWKAYFLENNLADEVLEISAKTNYNINKIYPLVEELTKEKRERLLAKGLRKVVIRTLIAGIPNVGKSHLINKIVKKKVAGVGNKPGFTRGKQWIRIKEGLELLDTPGILWPKFENHKVALNLAITGSIKDDILPVEEVASNFIDILKEKNKFKVLIEKYKLKEEDQEKHSEELLEEIGRNLGYILKGGKINVMNASLTLLRDYRSNKLGKFGIEKIENV